MPNKLSKVLRSRFVKCSCKCGYLARVSRKWLQVGSPICPQCIQPMKVQPHLGYVNHLAKPQAPDAAVVDKFLADVRAEKEAEMSQWRAKWALEAAARKRTEELSRQKEKEEEAAQWEEWKKRNPDYRQPQWPEAVWMQEARRRREADEKEARWTQEYRAQQERSHAEWEALRERQWQETLKRVEAMQAQREPEPQPEPAPQPRRTFGRAAIHAKWEENRSALTALRKPRVQERLIKDDPGGMDLKQAQESRQDDITEAADDGMDVPYPETSQIAEDGE